MKPSLRLAPLAAAWLAACSTPVSLSVPTPRLPDVIIPDNLAAPSGATLQRTLSAQGVQVYECRAAAGDAGAAWVFIAPDAQLFDAQGHPAGHHYAGPTWESTDGSKVVGVVQAKADAPDPADIPWLLLATHSTGRPGAFARIAVVQRLATKGGAMPAEGCLPDTIGQTARVPYTAQYTQFTTTP